MKKLLKLSLIALLSSLFFAQPAVTLAADDVYYDLGGESKLYIVAMVCKIADCINVGTATDWKDYSTTSENIAGDAGAGDTLVVAPGDNLTFLGASKVVGVGTTLDPVYGILFTNESYLTIDHAFGSVINGVDYADVDADEIDYSLVTYDNITLSSGLVETEEPNGQYGAISATVNSNTPDGTVITGTFYVVDDGLRDIGFGPQKALAADEHVRSTVRILVSNPAPAVAATPTATTTLPTTGANSKSQLPYQLLYISIILAIGETYILKRAKR
jgi:hypothetical protein